MSLSEPAAGAQWLFDQHVARKQFVPLPGRQASDRLDQAYDVQEKFVGLLQAAGHGSLAGYKIGLTTRRMQQMCGIDHPIAGVVLASRIHHAPASVSLTDFVRLGIEAELAVQLSRPLPAPPLTRDAVSACVGAVAAAFEMVEDRLADYKALDLISLVADNSWNRGIVLGKPRELRDLSDLEGMLSINGTEADRGNSCDVLGHPLDAVVWLGEHLSRRGQALAPGQWVMTGSIVPTKFPKSGERYVFSLGPLDPVELEVR
jgi:2-keto-4-pentenoate hydratase